MQSTECAHEPPEDLPAAKLEELLTELVEQYKAPTFQAALKEVLAAAAQRGIPLQLSLGPLVLQVQRPALQKYGLPPNATGVELMKHAVQRRIAEGSTHLECLANQARSLLGIEQLPDRSCSAEQKLAETADRTAERFGYSDPAAQAEFRRQCEAVLAESASRSALPPASVERLQELLNDSDQEALVPSFLCMHRMAQIGLPPDLLRCQRRFDQVAILEEAPSSDDFFQSFVLPGLPVVFRKAFDETRFSPLRDFSDFDFLRRKCRHRRVLVKSLGFDDEAGRPQFMSDPELKLPVVAFLEAVEAHERDGTRVPYYLGKVPLRAELPELADEVEAAGTSPGVEYGACFGKLLPEGVFTYFGCGRNTTTVHYDAHENLMLCICGTKRLWLYPPGNARYLYPIAKDRGAKADFSRSSVIPFQQLKDLSPELQKRYRLLDEAQPLEVMVYPGDLLYLPSCWWHCVEGSDDRNMILNWWFGLHPEKKAMAWTASQGIATPPE